MKSKIIEKHPYRGGFSDKVPQDKFELFENAGHALEEVEDEMFELAEKWFGENI